MANWCQNQLRINGDEKEIKKFKKQAKKRDTDLSLNNFIKIPKSQEKNWYNWCIKNWGTKWDIEAGLGGADANELFYAFDSAWSPPTEWLKKVAKKYPKLKFSLKYDEEGVGIMGVAIAEGYNFTDSFLEY